MKFKSTVAVPILLAGVFLLTAVFSLIPAEAIGLDENPYLSAIILQLVIFAIPALIFCSLRGGGEYTSNLRVRFPKPSTVLLMVCALVMMICGGGVIDYFMSVLSPSQMAESSAAEYAAFAMNSGLFNGLYLVLAFAILPAVTEEFLFRGIVLHEYSTRNIACSVIISALGFAMCHFSLVRLPSYFFCGVVLAAVTYATRSIIASMIVHAAYNVVVLFFEEYILHIAQKNNISGILLVIVMAFLTLAAAALASFEASALYRVYSEENYTSDHVPKKKTKFFASLAEAVFSPSFLVLAVIYIIMVIVI